ncbi:MAG: amidohydrolase [Aquificae bacterium]|nr:amidohydrolase [Aquificota bacterium]
MSELWEAVKGAALELKEEVIGWRRHLHQNPELPGEENETAAFVAETLRSLGVDEVYEGVGGTPSVVAYVFPPGGNKGKAVGLRADIDALPIEEKSAVPYRSRKKGVMHACGHDAHTAMLLGAAKILVDFRDRLRRPVKLIFQSCEEFPPCSGAKALVEAGVCDDLEVVFAQHVYPELPTGTIGARKGPMMAAADFFKIRLIGKSAHASKPHMGVDPILMAAQVINSVHHIVSRKVDPFQPAVITIGKIRGGFAPNQIPDEVDMEGTVRTFDETLRKKIVEWLEKAVWGTSLAYGGAYEFEYQEGYPPVVNDDRATEFGQRVAEKLFGPQSFVCLPRPSTGGEDFAYYLKKVPGAYFRLGIRNEEKGIVHPLHSAYFDVDEDALPLGTAFMAGLALGWPAP